MTAIGPSICLSSLLIAACAVPSAAVGTANVGPIIWGRIFEFKPAPDYRVLIIRSWGSGERMRFQHLPAYLPRPLPVIPAPLREGEAEPALDIQFAAQQTYARGPCQRGAINDDLPPEPNVADEHVVWLTARFAARQESPPRGSE